MTHQSKSYKKFVATAATATLVASAVVPMASAAPVDGFTDVSKDYKVEVNYLLENGIAKGTSDTTFGTGNNISRGDAAVMIANALNLDTVNAPNAGFQDVNTRVEGAVNAIVNAGIASGRTTAKFDPAAYITRQEMAKMLANAYNLTATEDAGFTDVNNNWKQYTSALKEAGITLGKSETTFAPIQNLTRGEFALFMYRAEVMPANDAVIVEEVSVVNETTTTVKLKVADKELTAADFKVLVNGTEVTPTKVESNANGDVYTITHASLKDAQGTVSVNGKQTAFDFVVVEAKVESVKAINATQVEVNFTQAVDETSAETLANYAINSNNPSTAALSSDGKKVTLTFAAASEVEVTNGVIVVEPITLANDEDKTTDKWTAVLNFKDEVKPEIEKVEAKTAGSAATSLTVTATEPIASSSAKVNGEYYAISWNGKTGTINGLNLDASKGHTVELVNLTDKAQTPNVTVSTSKTFNVTVDKAAPTASLSAVGDKAIKVTFNKPMNVSTVASAFGTNVPVKDEALALVNSTAVTTAVAGTNDTEFIIPITASNIYANKDNRTFHVVLPNTLEDKLGNKVSSTTQAITLTKDTAKPVATGYKVVKDSTGKVTAIEVNFNEELAADTQGNIAAPTIVDSNGRQMNSVLGTLTNDAVTAGDKKVVYQAGTPDKLTGKYAFSFPASAVSDMAETPNTSSAFNYTIDFGSASSSFDLTSATATGNVVTVNFGRAVKGGAVANSATDVNNYSLAGKPLPAGTTIVLDGGQTTATITLPTTDSVAKDDPTATFTVANVQSLTGETLKSYTGTVAIEDNTAPVLNSAKVLDNKTIELTYSEAIQIDAATTNMNLGDSFVIKQGDTVLGLANAELTGTVASGFDTKLVLKVAKGADTAGTPASATKGGANQSIATLTNQTSATTTGTGTFVIQSNGDVQNTADSNTVVTTLTGASGTWAGSFVYNGVTVAVAGGTDADTFTVSTTAAVAPTSATTLDLTKDITIETKAATPKKVVDKSAAKNEHKKAVKVNVVKP